MFKRYTHIRPDKLKYDVNASERQQAIDRLAEYEDLMLTPKQISWLLVYTTRAQEEEAIRRFPE